MSYKLIDNFSWAFAQWDATAGIVAGNTAGVLRFSDQASYATSGSSGQYATKNLGSAVAEAMFGFAVRFDTSATFWNTTSNELVLLELFDSGTTQLKFAIRGDGVVRVIRNTTVVGTGSLDIRTIGTGWYYFEWQVEIANSSTTGKNTVKLYTPSGASTTEINIAAATDTQNTANASFSSFRFGQVTASPAQTLYFTDFYWIDPLDGTAPTTQRGNMRVFSVQPSGNGNTNQYVNNAGNSTNNFNRVDDGVSAGVPNGDTDYVESATATERDLYTFGDLPTGFTIDAVNMLIYAKKTDVGSRDVKQTIRRSSTNYDQATIALTNSYVAHSTILTQDPSTSSAWGLSDFNGAEAGVKTET